MVAVTNDECTPRALRWPGRREFVGAAANFLRSERRRH